MSEVSLAALAAAVPVFAFAAFLFAQGIAAVVRPRAVRTFLGGFAATARAHFIEIAVRIVVGAGFVGFAPSTAFPAAFRLFGGVLLLTSLALLCVPWRRHRQFAQWAVPLATRHMPLYAAGCLVAAFAIVCGAGPGRLHG